MNVSYFAPYIDSSGIHVPTYQDVMEYFVERYKRIFGQDIYLKEDSPDYQLMSIYAKSCDDIYSMLVDTYNSRNPNWATGTSLDSIVAISGIKRKSATASKVVLTLTGAAGRSLSSGQLIRDANGYSWKTIEPVVFDSNGYATVTASCTTLGSIRAGANTINMIETPTSVWYTATNNSEATAGEDVEDDNSLRKRMAESNSLPSRSIIDGIRSSLINTTGVLGVNVLENPTGSTDEYGILAHSICAVVLGGSNADVAKNIYLKKTPGIATYGTSSETYTDSYGNQNTIYFTRPTQSPVDVTVTITKFQNFDETCSDNIESTIASYISSLGIGENLVVPYLYSMCYRADKSSSPSFAIDSITATCGQETVTDTLYASYDQIFTSGTISVQEGDI